MKAPWILIKLTSPGQWYKCPVAISQTEVQQDACTGVREESVLVGVLVHIKRGEKWAKCEIAIFHILKGEEKQNMLTRDRRINRGTKIRIRTRGDTKEEGTKGLGARGRRGTVGYGYLTGSQRSKRHTEEFSCITVLRPGRNITLFRERFGPISISSGLDLEIAS